jgi:broad specificity phosphatase PhoE
MKNPTLAPDRWLRCSSLSAIPAFERMLLLVRHAERSAIIDLRSHAQVMLTEQGRLDARAFGRALGARFDRIVAWHSPIPRCKETAELLVGGAGELAPGAECVGALDWLGGEFIGGNPEWGNAQFAAHGEYGFLRRWFDGVYSRREIAPLSEAAAYMLGRIREHLSVLRGPAAVGVTHDWNLMLLRESYLGLRHEEVGVPAFLDSVALLERSGKLVLWSLGRTVELDLASSSRKICGSL